jgi:hypothetical protein
VSGSSGEERLVKDAGVKRPWVKLDISLGFLGNAEARTKPSPEDFLE